MIFCYCEEMSLSEARLFTQKSFSLSHVNAILSFLLVGVQCIHLDLSHLSIFHCCFKYHLHALNVSQNINSNAKIARHLCAYIPGKKYGWC